MYRADLINGDRKNASNQKWAQQEHLRDKGRGKGGRGAEPVQNVDHIVVGWSGKMALGDYRKEKNIKKSGEEWGGCHTT